MRLVATPRRALDGYSVNWLCGGRVRLNPSIFFVFAIPLNHSEPDRKPADAIARIDIENRSPPPIGLRGALSA